MSNDEFREGQQEARNHGLKARHETREARAVRKAVAEEIVRAIDAKNEACAGMTSEEPEVYVVHHHDIEKHAEHFNEGYDEAHRQGIGGEASRNWLTEKVWPLLKDHIEPENSHHVADQIADALLSEADLDEGCTGEGRGRGHTYTAAEVKVLTETASKVAYALGRKDAGEEIAAACEKERELCDEGIDADGGRSYALAGTSIGLTQAARIARNIASQPSGATSDATSGVPGHQEVSEAARSPQESCGHPTCPCASQEAR